jgi:16S rRNA (guanine527-N7)-methyltransferase
MEIEINQFIKDLEEYCNISITSEQLDLLETYYKFLVQENLKYNLTSITDKYEVYYKHFLDSATIAKYYPINNQFFIDLGSGAGFPGVVLKILFPNIKIHLVDSNNKKILFLNLLVKLLNLKGVKISNTRFEQMKNIPNNTIVLSRAIGSVDTILSYYKGSNRSNLTYICQKGKPLTNEEQDLYLKNHKFIRTHQEYYFELPYSLGTRSLYIYN